MMQPPRPPAQKPKPRKPAVIFQPKTGKSMSKGMEMILNAVIPTLGPLPRLVALEKIASSNSRPEYLDSGGTIARRIIQIQKREQDVGAMFIRNILWQQHEKAGDGTATTAAMFNRLYAEGRRYILNGGDAMLLRQNLDAAIPDLLARLDAMTQPVRGKKALEGIAMAIGGDRPLARYLGEIFDIIGEFGRLEIRSGRSRELEREYVEGLWWDNGVISRDMIYDKRELRTTFENAHILLSNLPVEDENDLLPLLKVCVDNGVREILLMVSKLSERALGLLMLAPNLEKVKVMAVRPPGLAATDQYHALQDIAVLTGATPLTRDAGYNLAQVRFEHLGKARRVWGRAENFGLSGGAGGAVELRRHIANLRQAYLNAKNEDRPALLKRISRLMGGSATLWVGANTPLQVENLKELAERTSEAMRGAIREGVVPGGGTALLDCRLVLREKIAQSTDDEQKAAWRMLISMLEEPTRVLMGNAGYNSFEFLPLVNQAGEGHGMDVLSGKVVGMAEEGILDAASVVKSALRQAISGASLALTLDVVIHRKNPPDVLTTTE